MPNDFIFLFMIRVDTSPILFRFFFFIPSELIRPRLAVRVYPVRLLYLPKWGYTQRAMKVVSDNSGHVDFAIGLVNSVFNLPDGEVMFLEEF